MAQSVQSYFNFSQLSMAAYATLSPQTPTDDPVEYQTQYKNALVAAGFSQTQAADFAARYIVRDQSDPEQFGAFGFSATLFEDTLTGKRILAIRGTNDAADLLVDIANVALIGSLDLNPQYTALKGYLTTLTAEGGLLAGQTFSVAGHSLGGFLAQGLVADPTYGSLVDKAYTYNAPGFGGGFTTLLNTLGIQNPFIPSDAMSKIINLRASNGLSPIAGLGQHIGAIQNIFIEADSNLLSVHNHSITTSTDSLAVYDLFGRIDSTTVTVADITGILNATTKDPKSAAANDTLETTVEALNKLLLNQTVTISTDNRQALYTQILSLENNPIVNGGNAVITLVGLVKSSGEGAAAALKTQAEGDIAYRYALTELNPFVVAGVDYVTLHDANGQLDRFNVTTGEGALTDDYLTDRAQFLVTKIAFNTTDGGLFAATHFKDFATEFEIARDIPVSDVFFGSNHSEVITGGDGADRLYGGEGGDEIIGGVGADFLEGDAGHDILTGGQDNDTLNGGTGKDLYVYTSGDGQDMIIDSDKKGAIVYDEHVLAGGIKKAGETNYTSLDDQFTYQWGGTPGSDLTITGPGGTLTVKAFSNGQFGITLSDAPNIVTNFGAATRTEFLRIDHYDQIGANPDGSPILVPVYAPLFDGNSNNSSQAVPPLGGDNNLIHAGGGGDFIASAGGDDQLFGDAGGDTIFAGGGHDRVDGGAGDDELQGMGGDDVLYGRVGADLLFGDDPNDITVAGGADFLGGGEGLSSCMQRRTVHPLTWRMERMAA